MKTKVTAKMTDSSEFLVPQRVYRKGKRKSKSYEYNFASGAKRVTGTELTS